MWLKATRGLKGPPPSARVSDVLTACQEGRAPAAGSKWPLLRPSSRGRTELQSRRTQGRPPGPCVWGLLARAYPLRGARASPWRGALVWCARMAARALHALARLREEGRAGVGEYTLSYPSFSLQRQRRAEWGGGRSAAPTRKPERALVRSGAGLPLPPWPVPSLTLGGGEHRPKAAALAALPHCRLQRGLGVGPTTWRRARVTVSMVTMVLLRTDPPPPCLAQRAPCRGGPAGSVSGSGGGGEAVTDGHCGCAPALAESRAGAVRAPWDSACSLLASVLAASGRD
jgi:hypothetical protein